MAQVTAREVWSALLRQDFRTFLEKSFAHLNPSDGDFSCGWHHEAIAFRLGEIADGTLKRLIVTLPPRQLKSTIISVAWPAWMLGRFPEKRFVCVSFADDLALKHARDCRSIMQSHWYRETFPDVRLTRTAEHDIQTSKQGGRFSTTVGGTLTGLGGDIIIIDDPIKPSEANSEAARRSVNEWYGGTLVSRLNSQADGAIVLVMQRVHQDDLAGHLLEQGGWDQLRLPAIADEDVIVHIGKNRTHAWRNGDLLDPVRLSADILDGIKRGQGSAAFAAQFQQSPVPAEGNLVRREWLQRYAPTPARQPGDQVIQSWDTASKGGTQNDWSACVTALLRGNRLYLLDVFKARLEFPELKRKVMEHNRAYPNATLLIEDAASGQQLIQQLLHEQAIGVSRPIKCRSALDKTARLSGSSSLIENGTLLLPNEAPWLADFESELLGFPNAKHDDQVDALTQLLEWFTKRPRGMDLSLMSGGELFTENDISSGPVNIEDLLREALDLDAGKTEAAEVDFDVF
jgi:predicted phage terminase large subunit-like protein